MRYNQTQPRACVANEPNCQKFAQYDYYVGTFIFATIDARQILEAVRTYVRYPVCAAVIY